MGKVGNSDLKLEVYAETSLKILLYQNKEQGLYFL